MKHSFATFREDKRFHGLLFIENFQQFFNFINSSFTITLNTAEFC